MNTIETIIKWNPVLTEASKRIKELGKMAPDELDYRLSKSDMPAERKEWIKKKHANYRAGKMFKGHKPAGRNSTINSYLDEDNRSKKGRTNPKNTSGQKLVGKEEPIDKIISGRDPKRKYYDPQFDTLKGRLARKKKYGRLEY